MSTLAQVAPIDYSLVQTQDIDTYTPPSDFARLSDAGELFRGAWYAIGPRASQMVNLAGATATDLLEYTGTGQVLKAISPGIFEQSREQAFANVQQSRDYWGTWYKETQSQTMASSILRGFGEFAGAGVTGGVAGIGFGGGIDTALTEIEAGKTSGEALALGTVRGAADAVSAYLPFKISLLRGSGALSATAQRLGYGVGSNVAVGVGQRAAEKSLLYSFGYDKEAADKLVFDPTALAVDATLGLAFGGLARFGDIRAARAESRAVAADIATQPDRTSALEVTPEDVQANMGPAPTGFAAEQIELAIQTRRQELQAQAEARPFDRGEARALDGRLQEINAELNRLPAEPEQVSPEAVAARAQQMRADSPAMSAERAMNEAQRLETEAVANRAQSVHSRRQALQLEADNITGQLSQYRVAKDSAAAIAAMDQRMQYAKTPRERLQAAGIDEAQARPLLDQVAREEAEAVRVGRQKLTTAQVDAAMTANLRLFADDMAPGRPSDIGAHRAMMDEMQQASAEGRTPDTSVLAETEFTPDVRIARKEMSRAKAVLAEVPADERAAMGGDVTDRPVTAQSFRPESVSERESADMAAEESTRLMDTLGNDAVLIDENGQPRTVAEYRQAIQQAEAEANDEADTVAGLVACMIKEL